MKTKDEFRIELERRMSERIHLGMTTESYLIIMTEVTFEVIAECMVEAGVLKDH